jgi:signal recognition particle subunit SRP19
VPKSLGVTSPKLSELSEAAEKLGLEPESVSEAAYPRVWWEKTGYLLVKKNKKTTLLMKLAAQLSEVRKKNLQQSKRRK